MTPQWTLLQNDEERDNQYLAMLLIAGSVCWADEQHRNGLMSDEEYNKHVEPFREYVQSLPGFSDIRNPLAADPMINPDCCCSG